MSNNSTTSNRTSSKEKFIKINPLHNTHETLIVIAILNALIYLKANQNPAVICPTRKELTKIIKSKAQFKSILKALEEVNKIAIRPVPDMEAIGQCGIITIDHPVCGPIPVFAYRNKYINEFEYILVNSGLGDDEITVDVHTLHNRVQPVEEEALFYQIFLKTEEKVMANEISDRFQCETCDHYGLDVKNNFQETCLFDNSFIENTRCHCNKYVNNFKWEGDIQ